MIWGYRLAQVSANHWRVATLLWLFKLNLCPVYLELLHLFKSSKSLINYLPIYMGFPGGSDNKDSAWNTGELGLVPELGWSLVGGNDNRLQYSCLENPMDREAWLATVSWVSKSQTWLSDDKHTSAKHTSNYNQWTSWASSLFLRSLWVRLSWQELCLFCGSSKCIHIVFAIKWCHLALVTWDLIIHITLGIQDWW